MATDAAAQAIGTWLHGAATGAAHAVGNFNNWVQAQPSLQQGIGDLVSGAVNGQPAQAPAKGGPVAAATAGIKAPVYTQAYLNSQPNAVDQYATDARAALAAAQANGGKVGGGWTPDTLKGALASLSPSQGAAPAAAPTSLDLVRSVVASHGGLNAAQLAAITDSAAKLIPQKGGSPLDMQKMQNIDMYKGMVEANYAKEVQAANGDPKLIQQAGLNATGAMARIVSQANPLVDNNNAFVQQ